MDDLNRSEVTLERGKKENRKEYGPCYYGISSSRRTLNLKWEEISYPVFSFLTPLNTS